MTVGCKVVKSTLLLMLLCKQGLLEPATTSPCQAQEDLSDCKLLEGKQLATKGATLNEPDEYDANTDTTILAVLGPIPDFPHPIHGTLNMLIETHDKTRVRRDEHSAWVWIIHNSHGEIREVKSRIKEECWWGR